MMGIGATEKKAAAAFSEPEKLVAILLSPHDSRFISGVIDTSPVKSVNYGYFDK
jgi:hypothetical protein